MSDYQLCKLSEAHRGTSKTDPGQNTHRQCEKAIQLSNLGATIQLQMDRHSYLTVRENARMPPGWPREGYVECVWWEAEGALSSPQGSAGSISVSCGTPLGAVKSVPCFGFSEEACQQVS